MSIWDYVIAALIAAAVFFAVRRIRAGKGSCSCGCEGCQGCEKGRRKDA